MELNSNSKRSKLSMKLVSLILICSTFFALLATLFQIIYEFSQDVRRVSSGIDYVEKSYVSSLSLSLFKFNNKQIEAALEGIVKLEGIEYAHIEIIGEGASSDKFEAGAISDENNEIKKFPLSYKIIGEEVSHLGDLVIYVSYKEIYRRLFDKLLIILSTNLLKTLLVSFYMFFVFHYFVIRHLIAISEHALKIAKNRITKPLKIEREGFLSQEDEIDVVAKSINSMQICLVEQEEEQKSLSASLKSAIDSENAANKSKNEFILNVSKNFVAPIDAIVSDVKKLGGGGYLIEGSSANEITERIEKSAEKLFQLTQEIIEFSLTKVDVSKFNKESFHLLEFVEKIIEFSRSELLDKNIRIRKKFRKLDLLYADKQKISQVFKYLLSYVIHFTQQGREICFTIEQEPQKYMFKIESITSYDSDNSEKTLLSKVRVFRFLFI